MLNLRNFTRTFKYFGARRSFATAATSYNPYYILGVEKDMKFEDIKKQYYKLAAEYHPDINKAPEASKQFVLIKEAFETIKKWHGKAVKIDFEGGSTARPGFRSMRPNPEQYSDEFGNEERYDRDESEYKEWAYKASQSAEHDKFSDSFETINNIKDIKFRPLDIDIPDASKRFNLDENKAHISKFSDNSGFFFAVVLGCFLVIFNYTNKGENKAMDEMAENMIHNLKNKDEYRQLSLNENENLVKNISMDMRKHKSYVEFAGKLQGQMEGEKSFRNKFAPEPAKFVSFKPDE